MGAIRRFNAFEDENSVFQFIIDTRNIVAGATDGSENALTFTIPLRTSSNVNANAKFIIKVSDGRPDISVVGNAETASKSTLTFATAGIYTIELIGKFYGFGFYYKPPTSGHRGQDSRKIIKISRWGIPGFANFDTRAFYQCSNLVIDAPDVLRLPNSPSWFFQGIKEIRSSLNLVDTTIANDMDKILFSIEEPLSSIFNPFFKNLISVTQLYSDITFTNSVNKIEIISDSVTQLFQPWNNVVFQNTGTIELICQTPNLTTMFRVFWTGQVKTRCHGGKIDVRNVTNPSNWLNGIFTTAQVDATLLGWAELPFMQSGVTWNWNGSKYSNNPAVIAAYNKITNDWGVIFTNLTMA